VIQQWSLNDSLIFEFDKNTLLEEVTLWRGIETVYFLSNNISMDIFFINKKSGGSGSVKTWVGIMSSDYFKDCVL